MKIRLARTAGFCWGVKRALQIALRYSVLGNRNHRKVYTYGPLIHNQDVVDMLAQKGIKPLQRLPKTKKHCFLIMRAHGLAPATQQHLRTKGYKLVDATCPNVQHSQRKVREFSGKGYEIIICGDKKHAEVSSLVGYARHRPYLISSAHEAAVLDLSQAIKICLVAQSTFNKTEYQKIIEIIKAKCKKRVLSNRRGVWSEERDSDKLVILNTICRSSAQRQEEIVQMAHAVEAIIVIGARHSANTSRLAQIAQNTGIPTFYIQNEKDLSAKKLSNYHLIGVTSGTSTPDWIIKRVVGHLKQV